MVGERVKPTVWALSDIIPFTWSRERTFCLQAYVNLVHWIIELHRMAPDRWVTLRDVYRCTLDPERIERKIAEFEALCSATNRMRRARQSR